MTEYDNIVNRGTISAEGGKELHRILLNRVGDEIDRLHDWETRSRARVHGLDKKYFIG